MLLLRTGRFAKTKLSVVTVLQVLVALRFYLLVRPKSMDTGKPIFLLCLIQTLIPNMSHS